MNELRYRARWDPLWNRPLAVALLDSATDLNPHERPAAALKLLDELIGLLRREGSGWPDGPDRLLMTALGSRGVALMTLGRFPEAQVALNEAIELRCSPPDEALVDLRLLCAAVGVLATATIREAAGEVPEATEMVRQAVSDLQSIVDKPADAGGGVRALLTHAHARLQVLESDDTG